MTRAAEIAALRRARPRSRLLTASRWGLAALAAAAWASGEIQVGAVFTARRRGNLERFLTRDAMPRPLREDGFTWEGLGAWLGELLADYGLDATLATLAISVLAIVLAGTLGGLAAPLGATSLIRRDPFGVTQSAQGTVWRALTGGVRAAFVLMRAVPEYVLAFLLLATLGPNAWPAVLALALHNAGILGRLGSDTVENLDAAPLRALRGLGASRHQLVLAAVFPLALPRFLLYFFYRFETCVREATVLGMLGVVSLGYWIQEARARQRYDELLALVALGALLVIAADIASWAARSWIRRPD